jgi:hypothetical protein
MRVSGIGALVGAGVGAIARSAVIFANFGTETPLMFVLPSAAIGILVGTIAGALARPWIGALVGAILSAVVFELIMLPCISLVGTLGEITGKKDTDHGFLLATLMLAGEMGIAGALAGLIGGFVGRMSNKLPSGGQLPKNKPEDRETPTPPLPE